MSVLDTAIGWVAPPACLACSAEGSALCDNCQPVYITPYGEACWNCRVKSAGARTCKKCRPGAPSFFWISTIYEGKAAELLRVYKYGHLRAAAQPIADLMHRTAEDILGGELLRSGDYAVVPVPTATSRLRQRGFDHSALLARKIAKPLGLDYLPALGRLGQSRQVGAKRAERLNQLEDKYFIRLPSLVNGRRILLVDDVVTTGGSIRAATKALRAAGAKRVDALVFAKRL